MHRPMTYAYPRYAYDGPKNQYFVTTSVTGGYAYRKVKELASFLVTELTSVTAW